MLMGLTASAGLWMIIGGIVMMFLGCCKPGPDGLNMVFTGVLIFLLAFPVGDMELKHKRKH